MNLTSSFMSLFAIDDDNIDGSLVINTDGGNDDTYETFEPSDIIRHLSVQVFGINSSCWSAMVLWVAVADRAITCILLGATLLISPTQPYALLRLIFLVHKV